MVLSYPHVTSITSACTTDQTDDKCFGIIITLRPPAPEALASGWIAINSARGNLHHLVRLLFPLCNWTPGEVTHTAVHTTSARTLKSVLHYDFFQTDSRSLTLSCYALYIGSLKIQRTCMEMTHSAQLAVINCAVSQSYTFPLQAISLLIWPPYKSISYK